jgi:formylglycine-generating enzyme required for sulfatase activity
METKLGGYHAIQKQSGNGGVAQTSPVDAFPKGQSPDGVFDMAGNTNDWLYDWYDPEYYSKSPVIDPNGPIRKLKRKKWSIPGGWASNLQRCIRGGGWTDASGEQSLAEGGHSIRSDMRERTDQFSSDDHLGFRVTVSYY